MNVQRVNKVLSGCVLLTRARACQKPNTSDMGIAKSCPERSCSELSRPSFGWSVNVDSVCKFEIREPMTSVCKN